MRVSKIIAGLGNQLFTYAFYRQVEKKTGDTVYVDLGWFDYKDRFAWYPYQLDKLGLSVNRIERSKYCVKELYIKNHCIDEEQFKQIIFNVPVINLYTESSPYSCDELWQYDNAYYMGNFQNIDNLKDVIDEIRNTVKFDINNGRKYNEIKRRIKNDNHSVSLHIRLDDYPDKEDFERICTINYYLKAIKIMLKKNPYSNFYIFSNNIELAKKRLPIIGNYVFVDINDRMHGLGDMELMTLCRHNIIPNSTFGWWGAVLGHSNNKIVIAPDNFDDRYPQIKKEDMNLWFDDWIRISS